VAKRDLEAFAKTWFERWDQGVKAKKAWETAYEIGRCKDYWRGDQLEEPEDSFQQRKVQINRVHPDVKTSIPSVYFGTPFVRVKASPALADTPGQIPGRSIDDRIQLLQDTGNTLIRDDSVNFDESTHAALKEAYWAFGCVQAMYDSTPVENPAVTPAPPLKEKEDTAVGPELAKPRFGDVLGLHGDDVGPSISDERFYVRRIPARQVVVCADHTGVIKENAWIGYWSVHYLEDIKDSPVYKNVEDLKASGIKTNEDVGSRPDDGGSAVSSADKVKLYHIWDQRTMTYLVFAEGHTKGPIREKKFKRLPLKFYRPDVDPDSFYPIPPIYHQLHPQDEINDSREWLRKNRKGTVPRYTYDKLALDAKDMKKLESGEMGTYIPREANTHGVIEAVAQPNYSIVASQTLALANQEFTQAASKGAETHGVPESKTATQAKIIDVRAQVTESFERAAVAKWLASVVQEVVMLAIERMALPRWVMLNADNTAVGYSVEAQNIAAMWQEITFVDLRDAGNGLNWSVYIEEESMSPVAEEMERDRIMKVMSFAGNQIAVRLLHFSPELRKRVLSLHGVKSARDQELIGQAFAQLVQMEMQMAAIGGPATKGIPSPPAPSGPVGPPGPAGPGGPPMVPPKGPSPINAPV